MTPEDLESAKANKERRFFDAVLAYHRRQVLADKWGRRLASALFAIPRAICAAIRKGAGNFDT